MNELKVPNYDIDACAKSYMKDLKNFKPLNKDDEHSLIKSYKKNHDLDARNKLITSNLKYTCKIANKFRNRGIPFSYLISEANDALMYAIDKFDESKDVKIMSYARWWINQHLHKLTENNIELAKLMARKYFCNISDCIKLMLYQLTESHNNLAIM